MTLLSVRVRMRCVRARFYFGARAKCVRICSLRGFVGNSTLKHSKLKMLNTCRAIKERESTRTRTARLHIVGVRHQDTPSRAAVASATSGRFGCHALRARPSLAHPAISARRNRPVRMRRPRAGKLTGRSSCALSAQSLSFGHRHGSRAKQVRQQLD